MYPKEYRYSKEHEWVFVRDDGKVQFGVTEFAGEHLGDVVFVELPEVDTQIEQGEPFAVIESVKAVADCYAGVSGTVVEVNEKLEDDPALINQDPHGEGWIAIIDPSDLENELQNLMDVDEYEAYAAEDER